MTPAERKRLAGLLSMLGSDQVGERETALGKIHSQCGSPNTVFTDLLSASDRLEAAEKELATAESDRDGWIRAHDERAAENAALARRNTALAARIAALRALQFISSIRWGRMAAVGAVITLGVGGWRWSSEGAPPPDASPVTAAADAAVENGLRLVLAMTKWTEGETPPVVWRLSGNDHWWVVVRGTKDADSHTDGRSRPIERHCLKLHATKAVQDAGAFLTPQPYAAFGLWMRWPQRATECRSPGEKGYS